MELMTIINNVTNLLVIAGFAAFQAYDESVIIKHVKIDSEYAIDRKYKRIKSALLFLLVCELSWYANHEVLNTVLSACLCFSMWWLVFDYTLNKYRGLSIFYIGNQDHDDAATDLVFFKFFRENGGQVMLVVKILSILTLSYFLFR